MKPKFTDTHKYPNGYRKACDTDITKSWDRARKRLEALKDKRAEIVTDLKTYGAKHGSR